MTTIDRCRCPLHHRNQGIGRARSWALFRVGEARTHYVEQFTVPSWAEHQSQHDGRLTAEDQQIEDKAFAHIRGRPRTRHLLPADP